MDLTRARGYELKRTEIDVHRGPGVPRTMFAVLVPGAGAGVEQSAFAALELQRAIDARISVNGAVFAGLQLHAQFHLFGRSAHQPQALTRLVAVVHIVVGVGVQRRCDPEAVTDLVKIGLERRRGGYATGKRGFEHRPRAHDVAVDGLRDTADCLHQQMSRHCRDCIAARRIGQHADRDRERGDEYHVGDNQHQTQGGGLEKSEGHGRRAGFPASRQQEERRILRIAAPWCKSRRSGIGQPAPRV